MRQMIVTRGCPKSPPSFVLGVDNVAPPEINDKERTHFRLGSSLTGTLNTTSRDVTNSLTREYHQCYERTELSLPDLNFCTTLHMTENDPTLMPPRHACSFPPHA